MSSDPTNINPFDATAVAFTIVTADMEASERFYVDQLDHRVVERGALPIANPAIGLYESGRGYVLLVHSADPASAVVRLIEAPANAVPNRPRPQIHSYDGGLAAFELLTRDGMESFERLSAAGIESNSLPLPYFFENIAPLKNIYVRSYAAFGPAGEEIYISQHTKGDFRPPWTLPTLHGPILQAVVRAPDRMRVFAFYRTVFDIGPTVVIYCKHPEVDRIVDLPPGTSFEYGPLQRAGIEWQEFPFPDATVYPTTFDRTGAVSFTLQVNDLQAVRGRAERGSATIVSDTVLPLPGRTPAGFILRGGVGELVEVIQAP